MPTEDEQEDFKRDVKAFFDVCQHTYDCWLICRTIFDNESARRCFSGHKARYFLNWFNIVAIDYSLLQLAKLHDPATINKKKEIRNNLSLDYIIKYGRFDNDQKQKLGSLRDKMQELFGKIKPARHGLICHNDRDIIINNNKLGSFDSDLDDEYFNFLQQFIDVVEEKYYGVSCKMGTQATTDAEIFLKCIFPTYARDGSTGENEG
jgi:hypothetical protein